MEKKALEHTMAVVEGQQSDSLTKRITFNKETYRNLVTIASREYFDSKMKQDEMVSSMLDHIINDYYAQYWDKNKPGKLVK